MRIGSSEVLAASGFMALLLGIFVLISHITLLNMLVGVRGQSFWNTAPPGSYSLPSSRTLSTFRNALQRFRQYGHRLNGRESRAGEVSVEVG